MADVKLVMTMTTADGDKNFSYSYINPSITLTQVQNLGAALVTNGSIFTNPPLSTKAAKLVTTTTQDFSI